MLLESAIDFGAGIAMFGRVEVADRPDVTTTIIENPDGTHDHLIETLPARSGQVSAGSLLSHRIGRASLGIGARASVSFLPEALRGTYREPRAYGFALFASLRPAPAPASHAH
jgi:hypothetical protein